ncbi:MAG: S8 family peptidase [Paludibacter sp.]|jgi:hypothetical protein|nr:S8 family peptidase [Paludibacter sp.]
MPNIKRIIVCVSIVCAWCFVVVADDGYFFYVQLADKHDTPYSLANPSEYLSQRAIERRAFFGVAIDSTDLPVTPAYVSAVKNAGVSVAGKSRWTNGLTVFTSGDSSVIQNVRNLAFVTKVQYTGKRNILQTPAPALFPKISKTVGAGNSDNYGAAETQTKQIKADFLHNLGYRAEDVQIAVIDGGFLNADVNAAFDSLRLQNRLLGTHDFTCSSPNVYATEAHGANVLSILTGNLPNQFRGTAPQAEFWLLKSEYPLSEYRVETDFWVSAIEFADSAGVDMATTSLGYATKFTDAAMNFTYADMNGRVSRASIAATMAAQKGIIVCASAGNEGNKEWHYIGSPADAEGIITVGSVTATGAPSVFSSFGPTADGRIKPEVSALGSATYYINTAGSTFYGDGTSYSTPVFAGAMACLLQYAKENLSAFSLNELFTAVFSSANSYSAPTAQSGYGIPDFQIAVSNVNNLITNNHNKTSEVNKFFYNSKNKTVWLKKDIIGNENITLYSALGKIIFSKKITDEYVSLAEYNLPSGVYIVQTGNTRGKIIY